MDGFNIKRAPSKFEMQSDSIDNFLPSDVRVNCTEVPCEKLSDSGVSTLYVLPSAFSELNQQICWGKQTRINSREQGGILVGNVFKDINTQLVCGVVHHVIPSTKPGNANYIQFTHEDWILMYKEFGDKYSPVEEDERRLNVIGWYHTHPNMPVKMSEIDRHTHIGFFSEAWQFSIILNPQRGTWAVFNGNECKNCNGYIYHSLNVEEPLLKRDSSGNRINNNAHIDENPCVVQNFASASNDSFVIKRIPNPVAKHTSRYQVHNKTKQRNYTMEIIQYQGESYYFPYHLIQSTKSYIISDRLVKRFRRVLDNWNFSSGEAVSLSYIVKTSTHKLFKKDQHNYYQLCDDDSYSAQGFICEKNQSEYLVFHNKLSTYQQDVMLIVLFSNTLPDFKTICKKYCIADCLLWFNAKETQDFMFFCIEKGNFSTQKSPNFNIKNRPQAEINLGKNLVSVGCQTYGNSINTMDSAITPYIFTGIEGLLYQKCKVRMPNQALQETLKKIDQYRKFSEQFTIIIGFFAVVDTDRGLVSPLLNELSNLWFSLGNGCNATFVRLGDDRGAAHCTKFALIITNYDIDVKSAQLKLHDYTAALCFNIETQSQQFYSFL